MTTTGHPLDNTSLALTRIRRMIDSGAVPNEGRLPTERELSQQLDVGRHTVRRALEVLEAEGLVWRQQGKGTFVGQPPQIITGLAAEIAGDVDALAVMDARLGIEPQLAALCARRATAEDVDRLRMLADRVSHAQDRDSTELWDGALHRLIARIADNRLLSVAFGLVDEVRGSADWQQKRDLARSPALLKLYDSQHMAIIDAIDARDPDAAQAAMTDHLVHLTRNLRDSLKDHAHDH
ncbi:transcriptional regulator, GntR family [Loktanella atrilutea]|uniref:Transcriptional regulator, GntR family n=1 Tax=Loktanella atrilutea TaxID=366533 RepID=A0A1M4SQ75_LOKAT|nr:FadR/GntR family transcriptional regulator [Loktanella atrilutea]SHE34414.1 transcriptional regulator, GntR family [Loktanella atrilutea]